MLYDQVDHFYIVESIYTLDGEKKDSLYKDLNSDSFDSYKDKIQWIVSNDDLSTIANVEDRKKVLRSASSSFIRKDLEIGPYANPFIVINSDVDEIFTPNDLDEFQVGKKYGDIAIHGPVRLRMDYFTYNLQWKRNEKHLTVHTLPGWRLNPDNRCTLVYNLDKINY